MGRFSVYCVAEIRLVGGEVQNTVLVAVVGRDGWRRRGMGWDGMAVVTNGIVFAMLNWTGFTHTHTVSQGQIKSVGFFQPSASVSAWRRAFSPTPRLRKTPFLLRHCRSPRLFIRFRSAEGERERHRENTGSKVVSNRGRIRCARPEMDFNRVPMCGQTNIR